MSAAEIEAHRVFLAGLGIARQEIDLTINVIHSTLRGDEVAMPEALLQNSDRRGFTSLIHTFRRSG